MAERETEGERKRGVGRWRVRAAVAVAAGAVLILGGWLLCGWWHRASAWEQLVAINRAHLLDPGENAATVYDRLLAHPNWWPGALALLSARKNVTPASPDAEADAEAIPDQIAGGIIATMQEAARYEKCYFPFTQYNRRRERVVLIRCGAEITVLAARADLSAGRTASAHEKWQAVIRAAQHLRQQLLLSDLLMAVGIEMFVWRTVDDFLVREDATEEQLGMIESLVPALADNWKKEAALALRVQRLFAQMEKEEITLRERLADFWRGTGRTFAHDDNLPRGHYLHLLADRRGTRLLVALRRHKNMTGAWPRRLDDIRAKVPQEVWSDPYTRGQPFLYQTAGESFLLYCRGPDRRDQGGQGDDWPIWPRRRIAAARPPEKLP